FTGLNDGNYSYRAYVVDAGGNMNRTEARNFSVDTVAPTLSFIATTDANASFLNRSFTIVNISTTETSDHSVFVDFDRSLVGYWRFEDDADTNASDFSTYKNNGSLVGFGCTAADCNLTGGAGGVASGFVSAGKRGKAMAFDGVNDYITVPSTITSGFDQKFTASAWVKTNTLTGQSITGQWSGTTTTDRTFSLFVNANGTISFNVRTSSPQAQPEIVSSANVSDNRWHHVAGVRNGQNMLVYVDGVQSGSGTQSGTLEDSTHNFEIGRQSTDGAYFNGSIDEVKVWNRNLSAEEINASYQAGTYRYFKNFTGLSDGNYSYYAAVVDSAGTLVQATNRTIYVDTVPPAVSLISNTPANQSVLSTNSIFINTSENDGGNNHNELSAFIDFNNSLVGYWRFEDDSDGGNASDFTGYNNNGSLVGFGCTSLNCDLTGGAGGTGSGWTSSGKRGKALIFDAIDDQVDIPHNEAFNSSNMTVMFWMRPYPEQSGSSSSGVVGKGRPVNSGLSVNEGWAVGVSGGQIRFDSSNATHG
ncbi:MAG: LamG domain-containing protein, partial [Nanoarchaeota archaeon]